jgi:hypothetical protein
VDVSTLLMVTEGVSTEEAATLAGSEPGTSGARDAVREAGGPELVADTVETRSSVEEPLGTLSVPGVPGLLVLAALFPLVAPLNISRGKSATDMAILPKSPTKADVTAEIGSQG